MTTTPIRLAAFVLPILAAVAQAPQPEDADPLAAFRARPVQPAVADGQSVRVLDAERRPVAGADVFVADWQSLPPAMRHYVERTFVADAAVWLAAHTGARFRTGDDGSVRVPRIAGATIGAIAPGSDAVGLLLTGSRILLHGPRVAIPVTVVDQRGQPASGIPVAIAHTGGQGFHPLAGAITDARGRAVVRFERGADDREVEVRALCIGAPIRQTVPASWFAAPDAPIELRLPPFAGLRVRLESRDGKPMHDSRALLHGANGQNLAVAMRPAADGYLFAPIAPGAVVELELWHAGATGEPQRVPVDGFVAGRTQDLELTAEFLPPRTVSPLLRAALAQQPNVQVTKDGAVQWTPPPAPQGGK